MGRASRDSGRFRPRPVERIELNEEQLGRRFIAAGVLLLAGAALLAWGVMEFFTPGTGWQTIQAGGTGEPSCAEELTFLYEADAPAEVRTVSGLYTAACQRAYRLLNCDRDFEDTVNVYTLNHQPNAVLTVDEGLYRALSAVTDAGRRELYLGPVYARYDDLFFCQEDAQLVNYDPRRSGDVAREYQAVLSYANDPRAIDLELLGENRVRLRVSEAYLAYAAREGVERFIDFAWMRNAFVVDLVADELSAKGCAKGVLSSYDGFTRNLDAREGTYDYPLYHRQGDMVSFAGSLRYAGPMSLVCLRDFAANERDRQRFYTLSTGEVRTPYLDTADALCRNAVSSLVCYDRDRGCGQVLMEMIPAYVADTLEREDAAALAEKGVQSVWCQGTAVLYTEQEAVLADLAVRDGICYTAEWIGP